MGLVDFNEDFCPAYTYFRSYYQGAIARNLENKFDKGNNRTSGAVWDKHVGGFLKDEKKRTSRMEGVNPWQFICNGVGFEKKAKGEEVFPTHEAVCAEIEMYKVIQDSIVCYVMSGPVVDHFSICFVEFFTEDDIGDVTKVVTVKSANDSLGLVYWELVKLCRKVEFACELLATQLAGFLMLYSEAMERAEEWKKGERRRRAKCSLF